MKKLVTRILIFWSLLVIVLVFMIPYCKAKDFEFSVTGVIANSRTIWRSGMTPTPTGTLHENEFTIGPSTQIL